MQLNAGKLQLGKYKTKSGIIVDNETIMKRKLMLLAIGVIAVSILFLFAGVNWNHWQYAMKLRVPRLLAIAFTGGCIAFSSIIFQTITNNRILTPSVLGLDSMYTAVQTVIVFAFGVESIFLTSRMNNFLLAVVVMILATTLIYGNLLSKGKNIFLLLMIGMVLGTFFSSIATFMQVILEPSAYDALQSNLFASFSKVNIEILGVAVLIVVATIPYVYKELKYLDVISLGKDHAINLGVDYDKVVRKMIILVAILVSVSTALVGPISFLGLLVANLARQNFKTYKHSYLILAGILIGILALVGGQFMVERVFGFQTTIGVIINFVGGIYFIYLLLRESIE